MNARGTIIFGLALLATIGLLVGAWLKADVARHGLATEQGNLAAVSQRLAAEQRSLVIVSRRLAAEQRNLIAVNHGLATQQTGTCQQVEAVKRVVRQVIRQADDALGRKGSAGYDYYRIHPAELAAARKAGNAELGEFSARRC